MPRRAIRPGISSFISTTPQRDVIFTGDSAKNRAELLSGTADMTMDEDASKIATIERIWSCGAGVRKRCSIPATTFPWCSKTAARPISKARRAGITAWFDDDIETTTLFELKAVEPPAARRVAGSR